MTKLLKEGDIIELNNGDIVYGEVPKSLVYKNSPCDWTLVRHTITIGKFGFPSGKYIVYKTNLDGGGIGHNDHYPDEHHVFVVNNKYDRIKLDFYQVDDMEHKQAVGQAKLTWTI